jgi:HK97 family phage major capsid protein
MEEVVKKLDEVMTKSNENKEAIEAKIAAEVKAINEDLAKKGATLGDIQGEILEMKKANGALRLQSEKQKSAKEAIAEVFTKHYDELQSMISGPSQSWKFSQKAVANMTIANNLTAGSAYSTYSTTVADEPNSMLHFRDIVSVVPSATGIYQFPRFGGGEGAFATQTEGAAKGQVDYDFSMITVNASFLAGFLRVARQMMQDLPFVQSYLPGRLLEEYLQAEDSTFYTALAAAATGSSTVTGTPTVDVEQILGWVANLKAANHRPNAIILNPADWYKILITKPSDYSVPGATIIAPDGSIRLAGIPVRESTFIAEDKVLVGDMSKVQIIQAEGISVQAFEQDSDNVQKNLVTVRCEARVGLAVLRPEAFVVGDLGNIV